MNLFYIILLTLWSFFGAVTFYHVAEMIGRNCPKLWVMFILSGPIVWLLAVIAFFSLPR